MRVSIRLAVLVLLIAPAVFAAIPYDGNLVVYTSDRRGFARHEIEPLFDRLLSGPQPVVLFVHGRGDEPEKSLAGGSVVEGKAVAKLEQYGVKVVMLSWDSKRGRGLRDRSRPLRNTPDGADRFDQVLQALIRSQRNHPNHPPVTLLAHSMGTIVVQRYAERPAPWPTPRVFTNVVLSSSDADNQGHAGWVQEIAGVENVFVTVNAKDRVLIKSNNSRPSPSVLALGRSPGTIRAPNARYVTFSSKAHEIFSKDADRRVINDFFATVFNGRPVP